MQDIKKEAVILMKREPIREHKQKDECIFYDKNLQLWIDSTDGKPVVLQNEEKKLKRTMCSRELHGARSIIFDFCNTCGYQDRGERGSR